MRGVVSLALAIPARVAGGGPFPQRNLVVFLAFSVIVVTLVGQGLTLPMVIRRLGVVADDEGAAGDARRALGRLSEVALDHLDAVDMAGQVPGTAKGPGAVDEPTTAGGALGGTPARETGAIGAAGRIRGRCSSAGRAGTGPPDPRPGRC